MPGLDIRPATNDDCEYVWRLSHDPAVQQWSTRQETFTLEQHREWWKRRFGTPSQTRIWIAEQDGLEAGYVRYGKVVEDEFHVKQADEAEISIAVEPSRQTRGIGKDLLQETMPLACEWLGVSRLVALVLWENKRSHKLFRSVGFKYDNLEERMGKLHVRYRWVPDAV